MAAKNKGAFSNAQTTVMRAFRDLERAVMDMVMTTPKKAGTAKKRPAKKKARKR